MANCDFPAELRTPRLLLRLAQAEDGPAVADALEESMELLAPWFKWAEILERWGDRGDFELRPLTAFRRREEGNGPTYYFWNGPLVVGEIWLAMEAGDFRALEYHVWVRRSAAGAGYGAEASRALLAAAFAAGAERIEARAGSGNSRSRRLLTSVGFKRSGLAHDFDRYVITPETLLMVPQR